MFRNIFKKKQILMNIVTMNTLMICFFYSGHIFHTKTNTNLNDIGFTSAAKHSLNLSPVFVVR